jgi:hypothetical protein
MDDPHLAIFPQNGVLSKFESPAHTFGVDEFLETLSPGNQSSGGITLHSVAARCTGWRD